MRRSSAIAVALTITATALTAPRCPGQVFRGSHDPSFVRLPTSKE